jgi:hypothetical protein
MPREQLTAARKRVFHPLFLARSNARSMAANWYYSQKQIHLGLALLAFEPRGHALAAPRAVSKEHSGRGVTDRSSHALGDRANRAR